ncbi:MAG: hydroxymethylglutaryl-CoA lyase [Gammaproteobacteria bacterium]|nr:hydroxymethylglutaryl-CoA lyase [Gammaproteobacteria bacterium]MCY4227714.1 hydroxymethylglutaryl-CoA lyase [Gammaproteobacteria bacterium]MCY4313665.1 hydroxymethylglutaryl-CoA lyase [Gammaproteobacteria bacterium]
MIPKSVNIVEVGPRDGLQNESRVLPVRERIRLIENLAEAGLKQIEAGSFVRPDLLPQVSETDQVLAGLNLNAGIGYPVLVPNMRGLDNALSAGAREIAVFAAASETFSQKNINCSISDSIQRFTEIAKKAIDEGLKVRGYISCVLGCPYSGAMPPEKVLHVASCLQGIGCYEISLGDTIGVGTPVATQELIDTVSRDIPVDRLAVHFHDTYGQALANILVSLQAGISVVDSSVAGLGGCPYARGASGNVATEDVVYMLDGMGIHHGIDLNMLIATGQAICDLLDRPVMSKVSLARLPIECEG